MLYTCTHMATVGVKGLTLVTVCLGGRLSRRRRRLVYKVDDVAERRSSVNEVRHTRLDERPDVGRAGRRSGEPVGGRAEAGKHLDVATVVERSLAATKHLVDDDAERPDVGERRPAAVGRVGHHLGSHPAQRDDTTVADVKVLVGVDVATEAR